jgi:paired small multidrug resistance pump
MHSVRGFNRVPERLDTMRWYDLVGSVGVILIAAGFLLLQLERVASNSLLYLIANALGAALILLSLMFEFNLSAFLMEAFWLGVSLMGLARRMQRQRPL